MKPIFNYRLFYFFVFPLLFYTLLNPCGKFVAVKLQQPQEQRYPVLQVHAGYVRVSVIYRTLTRTTGSVTCVRDRKFLCVRVYTHGGWAHRQRVSPTFLTRKKS